MTVFLGYSAFRFAYLISISTALPSNWNSIRPESHHPRAALPEIFSSRDWRANEAAQISPDQIVPQAPMPLGRVSRFVRPAALPRRYLHQWTPHAVHDGRSRHRPAAGRCTRQPGKQASGLSPTPPEAPAPAGPRRPRGARGGLR